MDKNSIFLKIFQLVEKLGLENKLRIHQNFPKWRTKLSADMFWQIYMSFWLLFDDFLTTSDDFLMKF